MTSPMHGRRGSPSPLSVTELALATVAYVALAAAWLWPLPTAMTSHVVDLPPPSPLIRADLHLIMWALSWGAHAILHAPLTPFHANAFYPSASSLAYSESVFGYLPLYAPVYWLSGNPVLATNVLLLLLFALRGISMYVLARLFCTPAAAAIAGFLFLAEPNARHELMKFHAQGLFYMPLAIFFCERWLDESKTADAVGLTLSLLLQSATSFYLAYAQLFGFGAYLSVAAICSWQRLDLRKIGGLLIVGLLVGLGLLALASPYLALRELGVVPDYRAAAAPPIGLRPGIASRHVWENLTSRGVGPVGYVLVAMALLPPWRNRGRYVLIGLAVTLVSLVIAAGPSPAAWGYPYWTPYRLLMDWLPGFATIRLPSRFAIVATLGLCLLAAAGANRWLRSWRPLYQWSGLLVVAATFLLWARPQRLPLVEIPTPGTVPQAYAWLARHGRGRPLLELPSPSWEEAARRMLMSTYHWLPIVDGYSGYPVESDDFIHQVAKTLPSNTALQNLVDFVDVGWVLVHTDEMAAPAAAAWTAGDLPPGLTLERRFGSDLLFRVSREPRNDRRALLLSESQTLEGRARVRLGSACPGTISLRSSPPQPWPRGAYLPVTFLVSNRSDEVWPAAGILPHHLVRMRACFARPDQTGCSGPTTRIGSDVKPGATVIARPTLFAPKKPGTWVLLAELVQVGSGSLEECGLPPFRMSVEVR